MRSRIAVLLAALLAVLPATNAQQMPQSAASAIRLNLPANTKITAALLRPVWAARVKVGDPVFAITQQPVSVYAAVAFPVAVGSHVAIPLDTVVEGQLTTVPRVSRTTGQYFAQVQFTKLLYSNGTTLPINATDAATFLPSSLIEPLSAGELAVQPPPPPLPPPVTKKVFFGVIRHTTTPKPPKTRIPAGWQMQMTLSSPLTVDRAQIRTPAKPVAVASSTVGTPAD